MFLDGVWDPFYSLIAKTEMREIDIFSSKIECLFLLHSVTVILLKWSSGKVISEHFMLIGFSDVCDVFGALHLYFDFISTIRLDVLFRSVS